MSAENFSQFISKKSYEICYALFRLAQRVKHGSFADHLEGRGLELLESTVGENYKQALSAAKSIDYLVRIGSDVNILSTVNADLISLELRHLSSAIAELLESEKEPPIVLDDIFSKQPVLTSISSAQDKPVRAREALHIVENNAPLVVDELGRGFEPAFAVSNNGNGNGVLKSAIRQSAILEKIRQFGNLPDGRQGCRLKDLQDHFPETSERTIRYDVQSLIERGFIERLGNGGPSTYYRSKQGTESNL